MKNEEEEIGSLKTRLNYGDSDDCNIIVEDEVAGVATQIEDNVTSEGNVENNQNGEGLSNTLETSRMLRRSTRQKIIPTKFNDFVVNSSVRYWLEKYVCYANLSSVNHCFSTTLNKFTKPKIFHEGSQNPKWIEAMNLGMEAFMSYLIFLLKGVGICPSIN
ncbi:hypothetical protein Tco_0919900 [Tanacetum coccineum]